MLKKRWTQPILSLLNRYALDGKSAAEIKDILNSQFELEPKLTRNAVLAKASHIGVRLWGNKNFLKRKRKKRQALPTYKNNSIALNITLDDIDILPDDLGIIDP